MKHSEIKPQVSYLSNELIFHILSFSCLFSDSGKKNILHSATLVSKHLNPSDHWSNECKFNTFWKSKMQLERCSIFVVRHFTKVQYKADVKTKGKYIKFAWQILIIMHENYYYLLYYRNEDFLQLMVLLYQEKSPTRLQFTM